MASSSQNSAAFYKPTTQFENIQEILINENNGIRYYIKVTRINGQIYVGTSKSKLESGEWKPHKTFLLPLDAWNAFLANLPQVGPILWANHYSKLIPPRPPSPQGSYVKI